MKVIERTKYIVDTLEQYISRKHACPAKADQLTHICMFYIEYTSFLCFDTYIFI